MARLLVSLVTVGSAGIAVNLRHQDIAKAEKVSDRFIGPMMRLAYLSSDVFERLLVSREPPSVTIVQMIDATYLPWAEQMEKVFDGK
jgi:hypothetical protein